MWATLSHWVQWSQGQTAEQKTQLQLPEYSTTPKNSYLWLHSGVGACVPVVGVCCIMWFQSKTREGEKLGLFLYGTRSFCSNTEHSWIPPLNYVTAERSRGRRRGGPEVSQRLKWERAGPPLREEWARCTVSSSPLNHHHPSPPSPSVAPLCLHSSIIPSSGLHSSPWELVCDLVRVTQLLYKQPSRLFNGVWVCSTLLVNEVTLKSLKLVLFRLKLWVKLNTEEYSSVCDWIDHFVYWRLCTDL